MSAERSKLLQVHDQVDEVQSLMRTNIDKALTRGQVCGFFSSVFGFEKGIIINTQKSQKNKEKKRGNDGVCGGDTGLMDSLSTNSRDRACSVSCRRWRNWKTSLRNWTNTQAGSVRNLVHSSQRCAAGLPSLCVVVFALRLALLSAENVAFCGHSQFELL